MHAELSRRDQIEDCFTRVARFWLEGDSFEAYLHPPFTQGPGASERVVFYRRRQEIAGRKADAFECEGAIVTYRFVKS